jgi:hypothetical protein
VTGVTGGLTAAAVHAAAALHVHTGGPGDGGPPLTVPREAARRAAERELSRPVYHQDDPGPIRKALDWFWDHVAELSGKVSHVAPGGTVGLIVIVLVVLLLIIALRMRLGALRRGPASEPGLFDDGPRSASDHRAAAEAHAAAGHWSEALQERMRALVRSLEERALLDPRPGRTADEAATEAARSLPAHTDALHAAARAFDEVTYAHRPADAAGYGRLRDLDTALQATTPEPAGAGAGSGTHGGAR